MSATKRESAEAVLALVLVVVVVDIIVCVCFVCVCVCFVLFVIDGIVCGIGWLLKEWSIGFMVASRLWVCLRSVVVVFVRKNLRYEGKNEKKTDHGDV